MRRPRPGTRISLRRLDAQGRAQDLVGDVLDADDALIVVLPWDRAAVRVPLDSVIACREVPAKAVRPTSTPADLARLAARGWPGLEVERLGGWELRASAGYTRRGNSALCEGDPGMDVPAAVGRAIDFYRSRGLPPQVMLAARPGVQHPLHTPLVDDGWRPHSLTWLMARDLRFGPAAPLPENLRLSWSDRPDEDWLAAFGRPHPRQLAVLTAAQADYAALRAGDRLVGIARLAPTGDWVGISGLWVRPERRGQGIGSGLLSALADRGVARGARFGYLQVMADNAGARALYDALGWRIHHSCAYLTLD